MTETMALTHVLVDGQWGWLDWAIVAGLLLIFVGFIVGYTLLAKNIFNRQLNILQKALEEQSEMLNERARNLYLEHLPIIYAQLDKEVKRIEAIIERRIEEHDKDILFLLQEQYQLEDTLKGRVPEGALECIKLNREEMTEQALKILLARIRQANIQDRG